MKLIAETIAPEGSSIFLESVNEVAFLEIGYELEYGEFKILQVFAVSEDELESLDNGSMQTLFTDKNFSIIDRIAVDSIIDFMYAGHKKELTFLSSEDSDYLKLFICVDEKHLILKNENFGILKRIPEMRLVDANDGYRTIRIFRDGVGGFDDISGEVPEDWFVYVDIDYNGTKSQNEEPHLYLEFDLKQKYRKPIFSNELDTVDFKVNLSYGG